MLDRPASIPWPWPAPGSARGPPGSRRRRAQPAATRLIAGTPLHLGLPGEARPRVPLVAERTPQPHGLLDGRQGLAGPVGEVRLHGEALQQARALGLGEQPRVFERGAELRSGLTVGAGGRCALARGHGVAQDRPGLGCRPGVVGEPGRVHALRGPPAPRGSAGARRGGAGRTAPPRRRGGSARGGTARPSRRRRAGRCASRPPRRRGRPPSRPPPATTRTPRHERDDLDRRAGRGRRGGEPAQHRLADGRRHLRSAAREELGDQQRATAGERVHLGRRGARRAPPPPRATTAGATAVPPAAAAALRARGRSGTSAPGSSARKVSTSSTGRSARRRPRCTSQSRVASSAQCTSSTTSTVGSLRSASTTAR